MKVIVVEMAAPLNPYKGINKMFKIISIGNKINAKHRLTFGLPHPIITEARTDNIIEKAPPKSKILKADSAPEYLLE